MDNKLLTKTTLLKRAKSEGITVGRYTLTRWIKENAFPVIKSGNRVYIFWDNFVEFIKSGGDNNA